MTDHGPTFSNRPSTRPIGRGKSRFLPVVIVLFIAIVAALQVELIGAPPEKKNGAAVPKPRIVDWWFKRHAEHIGAMAKGDIDLLMIGDSITNNFESHGAKV